MNPLIQSQFHHLNRAIDQLQAVLAAQREHIDNQEAVQKDLLSRYWHERKEAAALRETIQDYDALKTEAAHLEAIQTALRKHLDSLHTHARALQAEYRP